MSSRVAAKRNELESVQLANLSADTCSATVELVHSLHAELSRLEKAERADGTRLNTQDQIVVEVISYFTALTGTGDPFVESVPTQLLQELLDFFVPLTEADLLLESSLLKHHHCFPLHHVWRLNRNCVLKWRNHYCQPDETLLTRYRGYNATERPFFDLRALPEMIIYIRNSKVKRVSDLLNFCSVHSYLGFHFGSCLLLSVYEQCFGSRLYR
ncbi:hypothetical protein V6N13_123527 [Hibiscus sabdariffa]|uniref:F-box domain-containing protein n=1 Tax=Hibiscus sabdariffa TaxID=183260 RepID=A0ABR2QTX9_9ROSI